MTASVLGATVTQAIPAFTDSVDQSTISFGSNKCGAYSYSLQLAGGGAAPSFISLVSTDISVTSVTASDVATYDLELVATLSDWSISATVPF